MAATTASSTTTGTTYCISSSDNATRAYSCSDTKCSTGAAVGVSCGFVGLGWTCQALTGSVNCSDATAVTSASQTQTLLRTTSAVGAAATASAGATASSSGSDQPSNSNLPLAATITLAVLAIIVFVGIIVAAVLFRLRGRRRNSRTGVIDGARGSGGGGVDGFFGNVGLFGFLNKHHQPIQHQNHQHHYHVQQHQQIPRQNTNYTNLLNRAPSMRSLPDPAIGQPAFYYKDDFFDDDEEGNNNHNNGSSANPPRPPQMNSSQAVAGNIFLASSDPAPTMLQQHDDRLHPYHGHHVNPFRDNTEDETPQNGGGFFTNVTAAAAAAATMPVSGKAIRTSGSMPRSTAMLDEFDMQVLRLQNEELIRENQRHLAELQRALIAHAAVAEQQEELRRASGDVRNSVSGGVSVQAMRSLVQEYEKEYLEYAQVMHKID